jgi:hypothetical protein
MLSLSTHLFSHWSIPLSVFFKIVNAEKKLNLFAALEYGLFVQRNLL